MEISLLNRTVAQRLDHSKLLHDWGVLAKRVVFTLVAIVVYEIISAIPLPSVNQRLLNKATNASVFQVLGMLSGGNYNVLSMLTMGISAYITAQIIVQLLQANVSKTLTRWSKSGYTGRYKLAQLTKILTVFFASLQALLILYGLDIYFNGHFLLGNKIITVSTLTVLLVAGTMFAVWISDQITSRGVGTGISIIIATSIIRTWPNTLNSFLKQTKPSLFQLIEWLAIALITLTVIVFASNAERRIPIRYSRQIALHTGYSYLPIKAIASNILPIIFAGTTMMVPQIILIMFKSLFSSYVWYWNLISVFSFQSAIGIILYAFLVVTFTVIYAPVQLNPEKIADTLMRQEGYISNIAPGEETSRYLTFVINRIAVPGGLFLALIAVTPMVTQNVFKTSTSLIMGLSGTSLIIIVGTFVEAFRQAKGIVQKSSYPSLFE